MSDETTQEVSEAVIDETPTAPQEATLADVIEQPSETEADQDHPDPQKEAEAEAKKQGWDPNFKPKKGFQRTLSAQEFLEQRERRHKTRQLEDTIRKQQQQIETLLKAQEYSQKSVQELEQDQREKELSIIKARQKQAVRDGDEALYEALDKQREDLQKKPLRTQPPPKPQQQTSQPDASANPDMQEFLRENTWYQTDAEMARYANYLGTELVKEGYTGKALLREVAKEVRRTMPQKFERPTKGTAIEAGELPAGATRTEKSRLPAEFKQLHDNYCESMTKNGTFKTKADASKDWMKTYNNMK